jgi:hypothetical protein
MSLENIAARIDISRSQGLERILFPSLSHSLVVIFFVAWPIEQGKQLIHAKPLQVLNLVTAECRSSHFAFLLLKLQRVLKHAVYLGQVTRTSKIRSSTVLSTFNL